MCLLSSVQILLDRRQAAVSDYKMVVNVPPTHPSAHETCDKLVNSVKLSNLHFVLQETPHSVYITIRKKYVHEAAVTKKNDENNNKEKSNSLESAYENLKHKYDEENKHLKEAQSLIKILQEKLEKVDGNPSVEADKLKRGNEKLLKKKSNFYKKQSRHDYGEEAACDTESEFPEARQFERYQNNIEVSVPTSNRFDILLTSSADSDPISNVNAQPFSVLSDLSKKTSTSVVRLPDPVCCSPRVTPSFTPPGTPPMTSTALEEEIKAAIRGLSLETKAMSESLTNRWK